MKNGFISISLLILVSSLVLGHGVGYKIIQGGVGINVYYEDIENSPISYAEVKVFSPQNEEFQQGYTDKNGTFIFYPTDVGVWKLEVNDGMGHGTVVKINVTADMLNKKAVNITNSQNFSLFQKIIIGLSVIWGTVGVLCLILAKKRS